MIRRSRQHLQEAGESYFQHQRFALRYACDCLLAGLMAATHALIPALFARAASDKVKELAHRQRPKH